ncbi:MAG: alpha-amylase family protein [Anaerolineae bacterium]|nr:alpha-amylase family protein [Anaerolineae bacterium]
MLISRDGTDSHNISADVVWERVSAESRFKRLYRYQQQAFKNRLEIGWDDIVRPLSLLYGERDDFADCVTRFVMIAADAFAIRPKALQDLDQRRILQPDWISRPDRTGYIAYTDRFAGDLNGVVDKIPYLNELDINLLHLMPLLKPRDGANDGGYAVADYRAIDPHLGTMADFEHLTEQLRANDISLMIDFVCNHTADDHEWAQRARAGEKAYQDYYFMFSERTLPDQYEQTLRIIFPESKQGNFIFDESSQKWVWSTFYPYQWDLNYHNPQVFIEMLDAMLYLANKGVEILRMDAVAFMWKEMGTSCESLPQAHALLQAFRALTKLVAPGLLLLAEAILSPKDVVPYFGVGAAAGKECELAYHNSLMVLLWSALAERNVRLLTHSLQQLPEMPDNTAWITYVRCHDDIGWAITDENAGALGLNGFWHRSFLSDFYSGQFDGSFARGAVFQYNPENQDRRISGACASLAGLELAIEKHSRYEAELAIGRILLIHNLICAYGGIPLIYMGDELGMLNDYTFQNDPEHADDNRWLHRPKMDWNLAALRNEPHHFAGRIFCSLQQIIAARRGCAALHAQATATPVWTHNDQVFGLLRHSPRGRLLILANFSERMQFIERARLNALGFHGNLFDRLTAQPIQGWRYLYMAPYQVFWLEQA